MDAMDLDKHLQILICSKLVWEIANLDNKLSKSSETWCSFLISDETAAWKGKKVKVSLCKATNQVTELLSSLECAFLQLM